MEKKQSQDLVKDVFQNSFDKTKFIRFIRELLNSYEEASFVYRGNTIPDAYDQYINTFERVGKYSDGENSIDILIVHLKKDSTLERARTRQRNFIAWYLNGSRGGKQKDAALVAFVSPDSADWRFSLVKMEYKFEEGKNGRTKVKEEFTPAKRWSFLVGSNENSHTAQSRLSPIVEDDSHNPLLKQLEEAFNIEKVTKEFFEKYRDLFLRVQETLEDIVSNNPAIKKDFAEKNVNIVDFSKKLLGQIVFLYFLQKKGWFGVPMTKSWGDGDKRFLRTLFTKACDADKNYFNDYLEPLFYEALAKERDDDFYSRFECKIPFLNGGLFDPINNYDWVNTAINIPNDLFSNDRKNPKTGDIGDGILDIFDRYNFTVKEDEPLEKEVAVDPEMLGKVFENLLEVKDRKSKGTYYTPREIVHYMCEQSLINYLATELEGKVSKEDLEKLIKFGENVAEHEATYIAKKENDPDYKGSYESILPESIGKFAEEVDDKLATIKVCDPAIGSGAFPVGMMSEIVKARTVLSSYIKNTDRTIYGFKRDCIQNSLYGVDLDPGAVEIAKLRLWLSLIVDEDDIKQIKPLPNLDYKIMQGNSLIEDLVIGDTVIKFNLDDLVKVDRRTKNAKNLFEKETQHKLFKDKSEDIFDELKKLHSVYFEENNKNKKLILKQKIDEKEQSFISAKCDEEIQRLNTVKKNTQDEKKIKIAEQQIEAIRTTLQKLERESSRPFFLWKLHFSEVFQENGGFDVVIANPPYVKEYINRSAFNGLRHSPYYQGKMDLWYLFTCKGIDLAKDDSGIVTFIAQNNWVTSYGASKMRNKVITDTQVLSLIDFGDFKIFQAGIQTMVMMFRKNTAIDDYSFDHRRLFGNALELDDVITILNKENNHKAEYLTPKINRDKFRDKMLTFSNSGTEPILEKILNKANFHLDANKEVAQGIVAPQDYVNKASQNVLGNEFNIGDGIFVLSDEELKGLKLTKNDLSITKPFYTTDELKRWNGNSKNTKWIIYTDSSFKDKKKMDAFPGIKNHLNRYIKVVTSDNKPYGLHRSRDNNFFIGEKIIALRKCTKPTFTYTDFDSYVSATFYVIKTERVDQKYLVAILNSKLVAFWLRHKGKMQGNNYQIDKEPIIDIPLYEASKTDQKDLASLTTKIIEFIKSTDYLASPEKQTKVREIERQIDELVYKLYGLTEDEVKTVEAN
ncbi:MAG: N-6 DNA methylase [Parcubacteria group bacterium]|nr:N-6 DNA methylase [Parcubacteria group bacterium]MCR4342905.1 N-6 DNA methylase [Patescibacteria group bacterium]